MSRRTAIDGQVIGVRTRSEAKTTAILEAATDEFLAQGFLVATMDGIAARAGVSKRTVYDHVGDKEQLFRTVVDGVVERSSTITGALATAFDAMEDLAELEELAVAYARAVTRPEVVRLRRLVIKEAERFPDLAERYLAHGPHAALGALTAGFAGLVDRGLLAAEPSRDLATQFAYGVLGPLVDEALFRPTQALPDPVVERQARAGARHFLHASRPA